MADKDKINLHICLTCAFGCAKAKQVATYAKIIQSDNTAM